MKDLFSVDFRDAIRKVVRSELKEKFGIKIHKEKHKGAVCFRFKRLNPFCGSMIKIIVFCLHFPIHFS